MMNILATHLIMVAVVIRLFYTRSGNNMIGDAWATVARECLAKYGQAIGERGRHGRGFHWNERIMWVELSPGRDVWRMASSTRGISICFLIRNKCVGWSSITSTSSCKESRGNV